jgi:hypothetical protein
MMWPMACCKQVIYLTVPLSGHLKNDLASMGIIGLKPCKTLKLPMNSAICGFSLPYLFGLWMISHV